MVGSKMKVPFSYDPSKESYQVGLAYTTLTFNPRRAVVVNNICPHCDDYVFSTPIECVIEDGKWKVKHGCGGTLYEEIIVVLKDD